MATERILMSKPDVGELEEEYVIAAIRSGWIAPLGPDVDAFEAEIAARVGVGSAVALASGTAALHLGLLALGIKADDIVVTSSMTFAATANAVVYTGATPFFVDSDPVTGNIDPDLLEQALESLAREGKPAAAVVTVDLLGKAADYTRIERICIERGIPLLCDAAESLGAKHDGRPAGAFGQASAFSFNGNKIMTTSGGGMFVSDDERLASQVRYLSTQARQPVVHYEHTDIGYNYRMSNLLAALGRAQLSRLDEMVERRRMWRKNYRQLIAPLRGIEVFGGDDGDDNCWLTSIIVDPNECIYSANDLRELLDRRGIESRPLWKPMHLQPIFRNCPQLINGTSERMFLNGLTVPSGSSMSDEEFDRITQCFSEVFAY